MLQVRVVKLKALPLLVKLFEVGRRSKLRANAHGILGRSPAAFVCSKPGVGHIVCNHAGNLAMLAENADALVEGGLPEELLCPAPIRLERDDIEALRLEYGSCGAT